MRVKPSGAISPSVILRLTGTSFADTRRRGRVRARSVNCADSIVEKLVVITESEPKAGEKLCEMDPFIPYQAKKTRKWPWQADEIGSEDKGWLNKFLLQRRMSDKGMEL